MDVNNIQILYNVCYGGFSPSDKAVELYNLRKLEIDPSYQCILSCVLIDRDDPILVKIYHELGRNFDVNYSNTNVFLLDKKYKNYYVINEYDGMEMVSIDINRYKLDNVKRILHNQQSNDKKIAELLKIFA